MNDIIASVPIEDRCPSNQPDGAHAFKRGAFVDSPIRCRYCGTKQQAAAKAAPTHPTATGELLAALGEHDASGWIPDIHLDDCADYACTGCDPQHLAEKAAAKPAPTNPTAREQLFRRVAGAFVDEAKANALLDAYRAEVLAEAANAVAAYAGTPLDANAKMLRRMASTDCANHVTDDESYCYDCRAQAGGAR